jgi:ribonuclease HII
MAADPRAQHRRPAEARVGGDRLVPQIAAASVVAKVMRDRLMRALARRRARPRSEAKPRRSGSSCGDGG